MRESFGRWLDPGLGSAVGMCALIVAWVSADSGRPLDAGAFGLAAMAAAAVWLRRRYPLLALVAADAATLGWLVAAYPGWAVAIAALITCYTVAEQRGWRQGLVAVVLNCLTSLSGMWLGRSFHLEPVVNAIAVSVALFALGAATFYYRAHRAATREEADREARQRAAEDRLRLAREVHDVCAHAMAAISVQAGVALHVVGQRPGQAIEALQAIKTLSDDGLAEIRMLLGSLRTGEPAPGLAGLDRLETLLDTARAAGMRPELTIRGQRRRLAQQIDLTAFRIIQESLTNVRRHSAASTANLVIIYGPDALTIEVCDGGPAVNSTRRDGSDGDGHGIRGMRERVTALRGEFTAGPRPGGGFVVRAELPT
ncbi:sensor histidine kinase [Nonomuraea sp. CA-141351]|uniref:sensor histidine kinase n=1 Tax=Nonomuraea sp. CA-141351 TaxID=3239996 RepID=UPI003D8BC816